MAPVYIGDQLFGSDEVRANREAVIDLRNTALIQSEMTWALTLSHTIVLLGELADQMELPHVRHP